MESTPLTQTKQDFISSIPESNQVTASTLNFVIWPDYMTMEELRIEIEAKKKVEIIGNKKLQSQKANSSQRAYIQQENQNPNTVSCNLSQQKENEEVPHVNESHEKKVNEDKAKQNTLNTILNGTASLLKAFVANQLCKQEENKNSQIVVAPFPALPKKEQINSLIELQAKEISTLKSQLILLEYQQKIRIEKVSKATGIESRLNVQNAKGFLRISE